MSPWRGREMSEAQEGNMLVHNRSEFCSAGVLGHPEIQWRSCSEVAHVALPSSQHLWMTQLWLSVLHVWRHTHAFPRLPRTSGMGAGEKPWEPGLSPGHHLL